MPNDPAGVVHVGASDPSTNIVNVLSADVVPLLALTTNLFSVLMPTSPGVPLIVPPLDNDNPVGKLPAITVNTRGRKPSVVPFIESHVTSVASATKFVKSVSFATKALV